jgi:hypothetical protein
MARTNIEWVGLIFDTAAAQQWTDLRSLFPRDSAYYGGLILNDLAAFQKHPLRHGAG